MSNMKFAFYSKESAFIITVNARLSLQLRPWKAAKCPYLWPMQTIDVNKTARMDLELPKFQSISL